MAGALYSKLDTIYTDLQNWKIEPPVNDLLDRVENYFNKVTSNNLIFLKKLILVYIANMLRVLREDQRRN